MAALMGGHDDCWCGGSYAPYGYGYTYSAPVRPWGYGFTYGWSPFRRYMTWGYAPYYYDTYGGSYYSSSYPMYAAPMGDTRSAARPDLDRPARIVRMTAQGRFEPAQITIRAGDRVEWRNESGHAHTVTANPERAANPAHVVLPEGAQPFDSGEIAPGASFSYTFDVPGTYIYVCSPHEERGMMGIVVVQDGEGRDAGTGGAPRPQPPAGQGDAADERRPPPPPASSENY
jgi:plastocyanin